VGGEATAASSKFPIIQKESSIGSEEDLSPNYFRRKSCASPYMRNDAMEKEVENEKEE